MQGSLAGKRIAILATDGFEQSELIEPRNALAAAGATIDIVSLRAGSIQGMKHQQQGEQIEVTALVGTARAADYDALVLPGGVANPDELRTHADAVQFVADFFRAGKPVGAICHGPWMLIEADVVGGRTLTSWPSLQTDLRNAGADWVDRDVVLDDNLVTSRKPSDLPAFCQTLIMLIGAIDGHSDDGNERPADRHHTDDIDRLLLRDDLDEAAKRHTLSEWERDARALQRAEDEGMNPGIGTEQIRIAEIRRAEKKLEQMRGGSEKPH
jgi:protease I